MPRGKYIRTEEWRSKLSKMFTGRLVSEETKKKMSAAQKGKKGHTLSVASKIKISKALKGIKRGPMKDGHRKLISMALQKHIASLTDEEQIIRLNKFNGVWWRGRELDENEDQPLDPKFIEKLDKALGIS